MSRQSKDIVVNGVVKSGFDYDLQVWVLDYIIQRCGHPKYMVNCCNGSRYAGMDIRHRKA